MHRALGRLQRSAAATLARRLPRCSPPAVTALTQSHPRRSHSTTTTSPPLTCPHYRCSLIRRMTSTTPGTSTPTPAPSDRKYKFYRSDFQPLEAKPLHLNLYLDIIESRVVVTNHTTFLYTPAADKPRTATLASIRLNSADLEVSSVERITQFTPLDYAAAASPTAAPTAAPTNITTHTASFGNPTPLSHTLHKDDNILEVQLDEPVQAGQQFVVRLVTIATPTAHILEGLYYDYTPSGCPRTIITQCQQYGFQRITPCQDYMTAKSYYTTTITADKRYTNIITNGDLAPGYVTEAGQPVPHPPPVLAPQDVADQRIERHTLKYHNHITNMAPYLFFLGVGTYATYRKQFEYPDGDTFALELLCFPSLVRAEDAERSLLSLHDSVMWTYLSTGPEAHLHDNERQQLYALIRRREQLKTEVEGGQAGEGSANKLKELADIRDEAKKLIGTWKKTGYKYTGAVYREIAMENSDYGGMENVGNTTILSSRLVASPLMTDPAYTYMEGVKVHEYYHNINGSEVTGFSPFEIWLNEAVTVHIQREREDMLFGADYNRLHTVVYAFAPAQGPLAIDASPLSMAVEPEGFNRTQELVSAMTYSKAPEFIRMVQTLIGKPNFNVGLDQYHTAFRYSNATTTDWVKAMEAASGQQLMSMADGWLRRTGYPHVTWSGAWDEAKKEYIVRVRQSVAKSDSKPWDFPVSWALVKDGVNVLEGVWRVHETESTFTVPNVSAKPDYLSFARDWSFFGTWKAEEQSLEVLRLQALSDSDVINRYFAYRAFADQTKATLIEAFVAKQEDKATVADEYVELHGRILFDDSINASTRQQMLTESEDISSRPDLGHYYWPLHYAKVALLQAVYDRYADQIIAQYELLEARNKPGPHLEGIHDRALKAHLFRIMAAGAKKSVLASRKPTAVKADVVGYSKKLTTSPFMQDKVFGAEQFLSSDASQDEKRSVLEYILSDFSRHPDTIESYIGIIAGVDSDYTPTLITDLINNHSLFNYSLAGHARTLARRWCANRKRALMTDDGLTLTVKLAVNIGKINQMSAQAILRIFSDVDKFTGQDKHRLIKALTKIKEGFDPKQQESLVNQLKQMLAKDKEEKAILAQKTQQQQPAQ